MSLTTLKDDLLHEFREERIMINEQIELLDPLATSLRKPAAQRLISSGVLIISEIACYLISLGGLACIGFLHKLYPFSTLSRVFYDPNLSSKIGNSNLFVLILSIYGLALLPVITVFIIGRMVREMRLKNDILNQAGRDVKSIVGMHLERKAALDTIEQRHMLGLSGVSVNNPQKQEAARQQASPQLTEGIIRMKPSVNQVLNPGFSK